MKFALWLGMDAVNVAATSESSNHGPRKSFDEVVRSQGVESELVQVKAELRLIRNQLNDLKKSFLILENRRREEGAASCKKRDDFSPGSTGFARRLGFSQHDRAVWDWAVIWASIQCTGCWIFIAYPGSWASVS